MPQYCVNKNAQPGSNDHEVHRLDTCPRLPLPQNREPLGEHTTCHTAVAAAKRKYPDSNGCAICSPACHTT